MKFTNTFHFPQDVDTIYQCYVDQDFLTKKMEALGARNIEIEIQKEGNETTIVIKREMQAEVPGPLKKFFQAWNGISQWEIWKGKSGGPYFAEMEMEINGVPATIKGQIELSTSKEGAVIANTTEVKSNIPFLGKTISKFIKEASETAIQEEFEYVKNHAGNRN